MPNDGLPRSSWIRRVAVVASLALIAAAAAVLALRPGADGVEIDRDAAPMPVEIVVAKQSEGYTVRRAYIGQIVPRRRSNLAFERSGLVAEVLVDDGERVEKGQVLARLDTKRLAAEKKRLEAELREVEAQLESARLTERRQRRLVRQGHSSQARFDDARFSALALVAQRDGVKAAIQTVDVDMEKSSLSAPFAGVVASRRVDEGTVIRAGQTVLRLSEAGAAEARIGVPADLTGDMKPGIRHTLVLGERRYEGVVSAVSPVVDPATRTIEVIFTIPDAEFVPDGTIVRLNLGHEVKDAGFWLPATALSESIRGLWRVYIMVPSGDDGETAYELDNRSVEILHVESERVFVRGTIQTGDRIIASGGYKLVVGQRVQPIGDAAASQETD